MKHTFKSFVLIAESGSLDDRLVQEVLTGSIDFKTEAPQTIDSIFRLVDEGVVDFPSLSKFVGILENPKIIYHSVPIMSLVDKMIRRLEKRVPKFISSWDDNDMTIFLQKACLLMTGPPFITSDVEEFMDDYGKTKFWNYKTRHKGNLTFGELFLSALLHASVYYQDHSQIITKDLLDSVSTKFLMDRLITAINVSKMDIQTINVIEKILRVDQQAGNRINHEKLYAVAQRRDSPILDTISKVTTDPDIVNMVTIQNVLSSCKSPTSGYVSRNQRLDSMHDRGVKLNDETIDIFVEYFVENKDNRFEAVVRLMSLARSFVLLYSYKDARKLLSNVLVNTLDMMPSSSYRNYPNERSHNNLLYVINTDLIVNGQLVLDLSVKSNKGTTLSELLVDYLTLNLGSFKLEFLAYMPITFLKAFAYRVWTMDESVSGMLWRDLVGTLNFILSTIMSSTSASDYNSWIDRVMKDRKVQERLNGVVLKSF